MKLVASILLLLASISAFADSYELILVWRDPTPPGPGYQPTYDLQVRINNGTPVEFTGFGSPNISQDIEALATDIVEVAVRSVNNLGGLNIAGPWTAWMAAEEPVVPAAQTGVKVIIIVKP